MNLTANSYGRKCNDFKRSTKRALADQQEVPWYAKFIFIV